jgi:hypothetical protein
VIGLAEGEAEGALRCLLQLTKALSSEMRLHSNPSLVTFAPPPHVIKIDYYVNKLKSRVTS